MHYFLTAAGLIALVGFAFGANAARAVAALTIIAMVLAVVAFGLWVAVEYFQPLSRITLERHTPHLQPVDFDPFKLP
jgi:hypothetical protein